MTMTKRRTTQRIIQNAICMLILAVLFTGCGYWVTAEKGDTLYSIARENGVTVNDILAENPTIADPDVITEGQKIKIPRTGRSITSTPTTTKPTPAAKKITPPARKAAKPKSSIKKRDLMPAASTTPVPVPIEKNKIKENPFIWPCSGTIIRNYGKGPDGYVNEGIDITSPAGTKIAASADGEVILVNTVAENVDTKDNRLKAWGNMVVIQHANKYVTVYAHNRVNLVKKGDKVSQGDIVAEVGDTGRAKQPHLHFEIRQNLESVNPLELLPK